MQMLSLAWKTLPAFKITNCWWKSSILPEEMAVQLTWLDQDEDDAINNGKAAAVALKEQGCLVCSTDFNRIVLAQTDPQEMALTDEDIVDCMVHIEEDEGDKSAREWGWGCAPLCSWDSQGLPDAAAVQPRPGLREERWACCLDD